MTQQLFSSAILLALEFVHLFSGPNAETTVSNPGVFVSRQILDQTVPPIHRQKPSLASDPTAGFGQLRPASFWSEKPMETSESW